MIMKCIIICPPLIFIIIIQRAGDAGSSTLSTMVLDAESQVTSSTATPDVTIGNVKGSPYKKFNNCYIAYSMSITVTMILSLLIFLAWHSLWYQLYKKILPCVYIHVQSHSSIFKM